MPGMGRPPMMNNYNNYGNYGNNYGNYGMPPMMQQPQPPMYGGPGRGGMGPRGRGHPAGRMVGVCTHCSTPDSAAVIVCLRLCLLLAAACITLYDMFTHCSWTEAAGSVSADIKWEHSVPTLPLMHECRMLC